jgi:hypothetical protein
MRGTRWLSASGAAAITVALSAGSCSSGGGGKSWASREGARYVTIRPGAVW